MNEVIAQDSRYPEWMKAWNARAAEIDQQIIDFFSDKTEQSIETLDELTNNISRWVEKQHMDEAAKAEFAKVKLDAKLFQAQVENRIGHLIQDGKLAWLKAVRKAGEK